MKRAVWLGCVSAALCIAMVAPAVAGASTSAKLSPAPPALQQGIPDQMFTRFAPQSPFAVAGEYCAQVIAKRAYADGVNTVKEAKKCELNGRPGEILMGMAKKHDAAVAKRKALARQKAAEAARRRAAYLASAARTWRDPMMATEAQKRARRHATVIKREPPPPDPDPYVYLPY